MARTHKHERHYQAKLSAIRYEIRVLKALDEYISGGTQTACRLDEIAARYAVRAQDLLDTKARL